MSFYEEVAKIQLYSDELVTSFKEQVTDVFSKLIVPQVKESIKLSVIVGLNYTKFREYLSIRSYSTTIESIPNTISLNLEFIEITEKLFDTYSIDILQSLLEKELGKEFNINVKITKDYKLYDILVNVSWQKALL
jgi:hypothetical protein